ncbi:hypothetical protein V5N11_009760 [Cardamine amara subsp. amara]|uniref:LSM domain-containing protein n=1 Tax=Cardamine amara subsp. amara TaxID=228776 RepID=A0ABD1BEA7_CARAN
MKKPPPAAPVAKDDGEGEGVKFAMGKVYSVKLITGDEFNGIVLAYDSNPNFVSFDILSIAALNCIFCYFFFSISSSLKIYLISHLNFDVSLTGY